MNRKGITLIELSTVMAIIAIGALLLSPNIGGWLHYYRLKSATQDIVSLMRVAQMKAVSTNDRYRVKFDQGEGSFVLERQVEKDWTAEADSQKLPKGIEMVELTFTGKIALFNPNATSSSGSVTLKNPRGSTKRIALTSATGRIRIE